MLRDDSMMRGVIGIGERNMSNASSSVGERLMSNTSIGERAMSNISIGERIMSNASIGELDRIKNEPDGRITFDDTMMLMGGHRSVGEGHPIKPCTMESTISMKNHFQSPADKWGKDNCANITKKTKALVSTLPSTTKSSSSSFYKKVPSDEDGVDHFLKMLTSSKLSSLCPKIEPVETKIIAKEETYNNPPSDEDAMLQMMKLIFSSSASSPASPEPIPSSELQFGYDSDNDLDISRHRMVRSRILTSSSESGYADYANIATATTPTKRNVSVKYNRYGGGGGERTTTKHLQRVVPNKKPVLSLIDDGPSIPRPNDVVIVLPTDAGYNELHELYRNDMFDEIVDITVAAYIQSLDGEEEDDASLIGIVHENEINESSDDDNNAEDEDSGDVAEDEDSGDVVEHNNENVHCLYPPLLHQTKSDTPLPKDPEQAVQSIIDTIHEYGGRFLRPIGPTTMLPPFVNDPINSIDSEALGWVEANISIVQKYTMDHFKQHLYIQQNTVPVEE